jgi:glycosyltransferase involved in cell wall biosynthesis
MDNVVWMLCKDEEFYIDMALDSVVRNVGGVYILDTGSTDATITIVRTFQNMYPKKIVLEQKDFGGDFRFGRPNADMQCVVRNYAMERAKGIFNPEGFLICLDADEIFNDRFFELLDGLKGDCLVHATNLLITPYTVSTHPLDVEERDGVKLFDPHNRAWRAQLPVQWINREGMHMAPRVNGNPLPNRVVTKDHVHFHLRYSFGPKCKKPDYDDLLWCRSKRFEVSLSYPIPEYTVRRWKEGVR